MAITVKTLKGGHLAELMAARMLEEDQLRKRFAKKCEKPAPKVLAAYEKMYGWHPAAELAEWQGVVDAYLDVRDAVSDVWMIGGSLEYAASKKKPTLEKLMTDHDGLITLFTGFEMFGMDPSGDRCFVSTLPHPLEVAEVHVYNHENGEMDGTLYYSIADFVFGNWGAGGASEASGGGTPPTSSKKEDEKLMKQFNGDMNAARKKISPLDDPRALFNRMKWMWSLPTGEPGYHFAEDMDKAPTFADWENEKSLFAEKPWLANYWMLAHYFLGNADALQQAIALAKKVPGEITAALAGTVAKNKIGKLKPKKLDELKQAVRKNADEKLLEPAAREATTKERSAGIKKADKKDVIARLKKGEDGWALIREFPDDVDAHDAILEAMAKGDKAFAKKLERYMQQRAEDDIYDVWPKEWSMDTFDSRLSPAIGAAFRAGLKFDADHKRASSSLVNTLAHLDDDVAMDAFAAAIEACRMDDDRLEYVVKALIDSKHPRAKAILQRAGWRFFEFFDATKKSMKKAADEGPTLNNIFQVHSHLLRALLAAIRFHDDEAEKLADKVLSVTQNMTVLGPAYAAAFRLVGERKLERHTKFAFGYCMGVDGLDGEFLDDSTCFNLAEASFAAAKLDREKAEKLLRGMLEKNRTHHEMTIDIIAAILAGLLTIAPKDPELLQWTERILGNRTGSERVYGALRGVAEGKVKEAKDWVRWHVYVGCGSIDIGAKPAINRAARAALVALGEPEPPPFDEEDEYGTKLKENQLAAALLEPGKHHLNNIFDKIAEKSARSPEIVANGGRVLADLYRFSIDDPSRSSDNDRKAGLAAMIVQGPPALDVLAPMLEMPFMSGSNKTIVLYMMGVITNVPALFGKLGDPIAMLQKPEPSFMGALDIVAGWAYATKGEAAAGAIESALRWRWSLVGEGYDHWIGQEPIANRLAHLVMRLPNGKKVLADLKKLDNYHAKEVLEAALKAKRGSIDNPARTLEQRINGPHYTVEIGDTMKWAATDVYCQGIVKNARYEQAHAIDPERPDTIARALLAIGFTSPESAKTRGRR